ncbi:MAG: membrane protein insertase YidC [Lachnospiraceae bacterium]|nr:membrane protein insertase YidC [Lachnospiraceae bacterium]
MSFGEFLGLLTIRPLELLFEMIFGIAKNEIGNVGVSIVVLSLVVNFLVLPLYARADKIQAEASKKQKEMEKWVKHIRKNFRGDERMMMLQAYYREKNYHPMSVLAQSVPLLLQVPFFIAAYRFLSSLEALNGMSLGPIRDLSAPDCLFTVGSFPVNVLPILMTLINIVSGLIYTRKQPLKMKIQINAMALVFLVLLYNSPSGLVFYWTCNNLFSLGKNIVTLIIRKVVRKREETSEDDNRIKESSKDRTGMLVFFTGALFLTILLGAYIPTNIIKASTQEFVELSNPHNPMLYVLYSFLYSSGAFLVWFGIFYFLAGKKSRFWFETGIWIIGAFSVINFLVEGSMLGLMSPSFQYAQLFVFGKKRIGLTVLLGLAFATLIVFLAKKQRKVLRILTLSVLASIVIITGINIGAINRDYKELDYLFKQGNLGPKITLSKNAPNVVVIMMDRALGVEAPYIFKERPELMESFDGFTYYPNTVSFGAYTNVGVPGIYGGYEYTPAKMNERTEDLLVTKHNEALKVMPVLFEENGYDVTVWDPSYAGYNWIPDLSVYDEYPKIKAFNTVGRFNEDAPEDAISIDSLRKRNFFCHSIMKAAPLFLQKYIYDNGFYNNQEYKVNNFGDQRYVSAGYRQEFLDWYLALDKMSELTDFTGSENGSFFIMSNGTTHEPCLLQEPDYTLQKYVDNTPYHENDEGRYVVDGVELDMATIMQNQHFCINMASYIELAKWFDYLKANDCYDNTRIIVVADHGKNVYHFPEFVNDEGVNLECFLPLLLVKDFNAHGFEICEDFMTNADTPSIAVKNLIADAKNPFTGNLLDGHEKKTKLQILYSEGFDTKVNNGNAFYPGNWYTVEGNPHVLENWEYLGYY